MPRREFHWSQAASYDVSKSVELHPESTMFAELFQRIGFQVTMRSPRR